MNVAPARSTWLHDARHLTIVVPWMSQERAPPLAEEAVDNGSSIARRSQRF